jgi:signal transduction histidine kinase
MEEDLRSQLASELHDEIGRDLTTLGIHCSIIGHQLPVELETCLVARVDDSRRLIEDVTRSVRNIMNRLRPPMLDDFGLPAALNWYGNLFSKRTGIAVRIRIDETCPRLTTDKETALFRIAQEALTNAAKHAAARTVTLMIACESGLLRLSIADDGKGFVRQPAATVRTESGWGLRIMCERAELIGAAFKVDSTPGMGTAVTVEIREV